MHKFIFLNYFVGIVRDPRRNYLEIIRTRPSNIETTYASNVNRIQLQTNYIKLDKSPQWAVHKYHVTFDPECDSSRMRNFLLAQHKQSFGGYLFDGLQLFVTRSISDNALELRSTLPKEGTEYTIRLKYTKAVLFNEDEMNQILNLILRRGTAALKLQLVNRNYYDAKAQVNK